MVLCIPLMENPLYEDPAQVRSTDRPCTLDICNTARSFTHESNICVIRRWAFLILDCIDHGLSSACMPAKPRAAHWKGEVLAQPQNLGRGQS